MTHPLNHLLTGVKCRATSVAKKHPICIDGNEMSKMLTQNFVGRYLDLDDIIEESSIETDDGAEEEEEDSDG